MTAYYFRAVTAEDRLETGTIDAVDLTDAARQLIDRGLYPVDLSQGARSLATVLMTPIGGRSLATADAAQLLADLGHLVGAGVEVASALAMMSATPAHRRTREVIENLVSQVRAGRPLSDAMAESVAGFPTHAVAAVRAGELSSLLGEALVRVADTMRRTALLRSQVRTALIYPSCIVVAVVAAIAVLVIVVVPTLETIFAGATHRLAWHTRALVISGHLLRDHMIAIVVITASLMVATAVALRNSRVRVRVEQTLLLTPVLGALIVAAETTRIATLLSMLVAARLSLVEALTLTCDGGRLVVTRDALTAAALKLREGARLHEVIADVPTLSPRVVALVRIGETTGRLGTLLEEAARGAEQEIATAIERFLALLTPVMTLVFGAVAGFVLYAVMTSILSVNNLVTRVP